MTTMRPSPEQIKTAIETNGKPVLVPVEPHKEGMIVGARSIEGRLYLLIRLPNNEEVYFRASDR